MFIAHRPTPSFAPLGAICGDGHTLRSSGAQASNNRKSYKHSAPPEQKQMSQLCHYPS